MKLRDLGGQRFGRLSVIERAQTSEKRVMWLCLCDCGNKKIVQANHLVEGSTLSCGKCADAKNSRLYRSVWNKIFQRCYNPRNKDFPNYGGRGISVCEEWRDYVAFRDWALSNGYNPDAVQGECTLDRINVNGNYEPSNCRFVSVKDQNRNKRNNHFVTYKGETHTIAEWSEITKISANALYNRINRGWDLNRAFTQKVRERGDDAR